MSNIEKGCYYVERTCNGHTPVPVAALNPGDVPEVFFIDQVDFENGEAVSVVMRSYDRLGRGAGGGRMGGAMLQLLDRISEQEFKRLCNPYVLLPDERPFSEVPVDADLGAPEWTWAFADGDIRGHLIRIDGEGCGIKYLLPRAVSQLVVQLRDRGALARSNGIKAYAAEILKLIG